MKQYNYKLVAIAGTFDRLHKGHRYFLSQAFKLGRKIIIGLTSDTFVKEKLKIKNEKLKINVNNYIERIRELEKFLRNEGLSKRAEIRKIDDIYGPAITDKAIEALIVTAETLKGANQVNKKRQALGLIPLKILQIPLILAEDKEKIASTRIRLGEIDRWGKKFELRIMNYELGINERLRQELKKPLGVLIEGDADNLFGITKKLKEAVSRTNSVLISTVGDEVTKLCNEIGMTINLAVVDLKVGRKEKYHSLEELGFQLPAGHSGKPKAHPESDSRQARMTKGKVIKQVDNPPGHITDELVDVVKNAYSEIITDGKPRVIQVDGEEDLAGVPAILLAPLGTLVLYGQPGEGVVVVEVTEEIKQKLLKLLEQHFQ